MIFLSHREQLRAALEYVREWNTNSRLCHAAQALLAAILRRHPPQVSAACQRCVASASCPHWLSICGEISCMDHRH